MTGVKRKDRGNPKYDKSGKALGFRMVRRECPVSETNSGKAGDGNRHPREADGGNRILTAQTESVPGGEPLNSGPVEKRRGSERRFLFLGDHLVTE